MIDRFLRDTWLHALAQIVQVVANLVTAIIVARVLGTEARGVVAALLLLPVTIHALSGAGFSAAIVQFVAAKTWTPQDVMPRTLGVWLLLSLVMLGLGGLGISFSERFLPNTSTPMLLLSLTLLPPLFLRVCLGAVIRGRREYAGLVLCNAIASSLGVALAALLVWYLQIGVLGAILARVGVEVAASGSLLAWLTPKLGYGFFRQGISLRPSLLREVFAFGGLSQVGSMAGFLNTRIDQFLINGMLGSVALGIYAVATQLAEKLWLFVTNLGAVVVPVAAENRDNPAAFASFTARLASLLLSAAIAAGVVLGSIAPWVVHLLFGAEFAEAGTVLRWLIPGVCVMGHGRILVGFLVGLGRPGIHALGSIGAATVNVVANLLLIPQFGLVGAALATTVSYSLLAGFAAMAFVRVTGVSWRSLLIPRWDDIKALSKKTLSLAKKGRAVSTPST